MNNGTRIIAACLAALTLAGCSLLGGGGSAEESVSNPSASAPSADLTAYYRQTVVWSGCGDGFRCARIKVPRDYGSAGSDLELAVIRRPADSDEPVGSLVVNPGGPGASGVAYARAGAAVATPDVLEVYDLVGFDPRGVASSDPVDCVDDAQLDALFAVDTTPDDPAEVDELASKSAAMGAGCAQRSPNLAPYLDSVAVARDMDILRAVLGDEKLNFLGKSYGSLLGALYAQMFPQQVGRVVLDGVLPNGLDGDRLSHDQAVAFDAVLRRFVEWCIDDGDDCPLPPNVDQGVARIQQFLDSLDSSPLPGIESRELTQALGTSAIVSYLYFPPADWVLLEYGLDAAFEGDGSVLLDMLDDRTERRSDGTFASNFNEAIYAVNCLDRPAAGGVDHVASLAASWAADAPTFGPTLAWSTLPCWQWPFAATPSPGDPPTATPIHAEGAGPILVVTTRHDPATPYQWGVQVADELASGHLLTYEGDGHTAYRGGSSCVDAAVDAYLLEGTTPAEGASCPAIPPGHES